VPDDTYADIKSVNPEALTRGSGEYLSALYGCGQLPDRSADPPLGSDTNTGEDQLARIRLLAPTLGKRLKEFLEGFRALTFRTFFGGSSFAAR